MRDLSTLLCQVVMRQVLATVQLPAHLSGYLVVAGLPIPTDDLIRYTWARTIGLLV